MSGPQDLLIELGTEELPPKALKNLSRAFTDGIAAGLNKVDLKFSEIQGFATPRRLGVLVKSLAPSQPDKTVERRGPAISACYDANNQPTKAAQGFARSCGVELDQLERLETDKGSWVMFRSQQVGQGVEQLIPEITQQTLDKLPIPKRMRWGDSAVTFVRPVHWLVLLFGEKIIPATVLGVDSSNQSRGHRFHHPQAIEISEPAAYATQLESEGMVMADFQRRRDTIRQQVTEIAKKVNGTAVIDNSLLDEVTAMVEWPLAVLGNFDPQFLEVPAEALTSAMKDHQKYFHLVDQNGALLPHFVTISNIDSREPDTVRNGNERVIRPRLTDARFFWETDCKKPLRQRVEQLETVTFQKSLGSLKDKSERITDLAVFISENIGGTREWAAGAAALCKCDLLTEMVGEFPDLQGIMGRYYAEHDGEPEEVATALDEHYWPRHAGDQLPQTDSGKAVAIADRIDTLAGIFAIGQPPSGDKDPFGLRRSALGALRIIIEQKLDLDLVALLEQACDRVLNHLGDDSSIDRERLVTQVFDFMMERLRVYYADQNIAGDVFAAVADRKPRRPLDFDARLRAVTEFRQLEAAESLAAANKRISNILKKTDNIKAVKLNSEALVEDSEKQLAQQVLELEQQLTPLFENADYTAAMKQLADLRESVDRFFDQVMVMTDDLVLRNNRLALLQRMRGLFLQVADLSRLQ